MENNFVKEARKQYLHYFRFWFLAIGILAVVCIVLSLIKGEDDNTSRANDEAPAERVYDYAAVLTDKEEEDLRQYIAQREQKLGIDIVLVTISQPIDGDWERNMLAIADDFWDENHFGYNKSFEGDGILLLSNWYEGQKGEMFSTSGKVEWALSSNDIDRILDAVYVYIDTDPYRAYQAYVDEIDSLMDTSAAPFSWMVAIVLPAIIALIYAFNGLHQKKAENTVTVNTYVSGGKPVLKDKTDAFLKKNVVTRRIETNTGGGGSGSNRGGSGSGGGGHHHSSSGASHGGGGRRR